MCILLSDNDDKVVNWQMVKSLDFTFIIIFFFSAPRALMVGLFVMILAQLNHAYYEAGN